MSKAPEFVARILEYYNRPQRPPFTDCYRWARQDAAEQGWPVLSLSAASRAAGKALDGEAQPRTYDRTIVHVQRFAQSGTYHVIGLPEASPIFPNRPEAEKWLRSHIAARPASHRPRERPCICCGAPMISQHFGHRMCPTCRHHSDGGSMAVAAGGSSRVRRIART